MCTVCGGGIDVKVNDAMCASPLSLPALPAVTCCAYSNHN